MSADTPPVFTFDHYEPGKVYGVKRFCVDEARVAQWRSGAVFTPTTSTPSIPARCQAACWP
jgi:hypothetical protein